jgi:hypothetical protein
LIIAKFAAPFTSFDATRPTAFNSALPLVADSFRFHQASHPHRFESVVQRLRTEQQLVRLRTAAITASSPLRRPQAQDAGIGSSGCYPGSRLSCQSFEETRLE